MTPKAADDLFEYKVEGNEVYWFDALKEN